MHESSTTAEPPLQCLSCWYVIGVREADICPECGEPVTEITRRLHHRRAAVAQSVRRGARRGAITCLSAIVLYVVIITAGSSDKRLAFTAGAAAAALYLLGWAAGFMVTPWRGAKRRALDPRPERTLVRLLWNRHVIMLHIPWLLPPGIAAVLMVVGACSRMLSIHSQMVDLAAMAILLGVWLATSMISISEWTRRWAQDVEDACLETTGATQRATLVAFVLSAINLVVGCAAVLASLGLAIKVLQTSFQR